jgi:hypothetical protein
MSAANGEICRIYNHLRHSALGVGAEDFAEIRQALA